MTGWLTLLLSGSADPTAYCLALAGAVLLLAATVTARVVMERSKRATYLAVVRALPADTSFNVKTRTGARLEIRRAPEPSTPSARAESGALPELRSTGPRRVRRVP